jgi:ELWxxDGT repeat protein
MNKYASNTPQLLIKAVVAVSLIFSSLMSNAQTATIVKDINVGSVSSNPTNFINYNNAVYFSASDVGGEKLYKSDGTNGGTVVVALSLGAGRTKSSAMVVFNGQIYFLATKSSATLPSGVETIELWKTNGTTMMDWAKVWCKLHQALV